MFIYTDRYVGTDCQGLSLHMVNRSCVQ